MAFDINKIMTFDNLLELDTLEGFYQKLDNPHTLSGILKGATKAEADSILHVSQIAAFTNLASNQLVKRGNITKPLMEYRGLDPFCIQFPTYYKIPLAESDINLPCTGSPTVWNDYFTEDSSIVIGTIIYTLQNVPIDDNIVFDGGGKWWASPGETIEYRISAAGAVQGISNC